MIISHRHRFVFFAVPRAATHSVRQALRPSLADDDWEQQTLDGRQRIPIAGIARLEHGHVSARQAEAHLPAEIWRDYFKFAFVRDPFERFVSICCFLHRSHPEFPGHETAFMKEALSRPQFRRRVLVVPQTTLLCRAGGILAMDFIGRYERLQRDFDELCQRLGIPPASLTARNASTHGDHRRYYDDVLERSVANFYAADFEHLGYPPRLQPERKAQCS